MYSALCAIVLAAATLTAPASAQELEPRLMSNVPRGMNFAIVGYSYSRGNILLDPSIPIEDLDSKLHTMVAAYVRSIALFGQAGKIDAVVPFAAGDWRGRLDGQDTTRVIDGFGDPRIRLSWNSFGSPSLSRAEFRDYHQGTIVGASIQVSVPIGQYDPTKLINLSTNRWTFRPQLGVSQAVGPWLLEAYASAWFFTENGDFFNGSTLTQQPLFAGKVHVVRLLPKGFWIAVDGGYGVGGRTFIDGEQRNTHIIVPIWRDSRSATCAAAYAQVRTRIRRADRTRARFRCGGGDVSVQVGRKVSADCKLQIADCRMQNECRMQNAECRMMNDELRATG